MTNWQGRACPNNGRSMSVPPSPFLNHCIFAFPQGEGAAMVTAVSENDSESLKRELGNAKETIASLTCASLPNPPAAPPF